MRIALVMCLLAASAVATAGTGRLVLPVSDPTSLGQIEHAYAMIQLADGRLLAGGYSENDGTTSAATLACISSVDGSLSPAFHGGVVRSEFLGLEAVVSGLAQLPNGDVVATGNLFDPDTVEGLAFMQIYRLDGRVIFSAAYPDFAAFGRVAIDRDGRIVVIGVATDDLLGFDGDFLVARFLPNGDPDLSFGGGAGFVTIDFAGADDFATSVAFDRADRIVVGGTTDDRFGLARLKVDGALDRSFGHGGLVTATFGSDPQSLSKIAIDHHDHIVAVGSVGDPGLSHVVHEIGVMRFKPQGALDPTFGSGGKVVLQNEKRASYATDEVIDIDGRVVLTGYDSKLTGTIQTWDFVAARLLDDGTLDRTFAGSGIRDIEFYGGIANARSEAMVQLHDGKYMFAGIAADESLAISIPRFAFSRLGGDGELDLTFGDAP